MCIIINYCYIYIYKMKTAFVKQLVCWNNRAIRIFFAIDCKMIDDCLKYKTLTGMTVIHGSPQYLYQPETDK